jgi:N-carbamoyl-L-amino-acid hydrolase
MDPDLTRDFLDCFGGLAAIGRDPATGGYQRFAWTDEDRAARQWFAAQSKARGLAYQRDANGNLWAWWRAPMPEAREAGPPEAAGAQAPEAAGARQPEAGAAPGEGRVLVVGSHLDTVPQGGAYDGALGVVAGFVAVSALARRGVTPNRPVAVAAFADEEGGRFGLATFGSRLLAGTLAPADALARRDALGVTVAEAMRADGLDPGRAGPDPALAGLVGEVVELHVEQGRGLADVPAPLGVGTGIWPHGRWRLALRGEPNHAGTTRLEDRRDPMLVLARGVEAARALAAGAGAVATVGRVLVDPNGTNSVPGAVDAWLDARAPDEATLDGLVGAWQREVAKAGRLHRVEVGLACESRSPAVEFDADLRARLVALLGQQGLPAPELPTAAGHDAGALAAVVPTAMLFVRNPTGTSHSPAEQAADADCALGCEVLAAVVEAWACR